MLNLIAKEKLSFIGHSVHKIIIYFFIDIL